MSTLIVGPPCSGKTTYALAHTSGPVADRDSMDEATFRQTASRTGAWIIACAPSRRERSLYRRLYGVSRTLVFLTPERECLARLAAQDRPDKKGVIEAIRRWWREYEPSRSVPEERITTARVEAAGFTEVSSPNA